MSTFVDLLSQCLHIFSLGELSALTQPSSSTFSLLRFCGSGILTLIFPSAFFELSLSPYLAIFASLWSSNGIFIFYVTFAVWGIW
jgi:hypothetical protein